jgi:DNA adenine methylase
LLERAYCFWYVNRTSISGIGGFSVNLISRCGISKSTSDFLANLENLEFIHKRLQTVIIRNLDIFKLLEEYNKESCFLYLDPPYHQSTRTSTRYKIDFSDEQHRQLIDRCLVSKSKIMISGYDNPEYNRLIAADWKKIDMEIKTTSGNGEKKTKIESIWINY